MKLRHNHKPTLLIIPAILITFIASCEPLVNGNDPAGIAEIVNSYEYSYIENANGYKACVANVRITNTGTEKITISVVSLYFRTNIKTYYRSETTNLPIAPGSTVYMTISNVYATRSDVTTNTAGLTTAGPITESILLNGIGVSNQNFYE